MIFWAFFHCSPSFLYFEGVFNKTIIPLALVGYEMILANSAQSIMSYPTCAHGIIVNSSRGEGGEGYTHITSVMCPGIHISL